MHLGETGPLSQGVQARRKALRIRHIIGMEVRKKRPTGFKKEAQGVQVNPLNPLYVAPWNAPSKASSMKRSEDGALELEPTQLPNCFGAISGGEQQQGQQEEQQTSSGTGGSTTTLRSFATVAFEVDEVSIDSDRARKHTSGIG
jgi:hypothetical protein